jgi:hypothetical protein
VLISWDAQDQTVLMAPAATRALISREFMFRAPLAYLREPFDRFERDLAASANAS